LNHEELVLLSCMTGNDYAPNFYGYRLTALKNVLFTCKAKKIRGSLRHIEELERAIDQFGQWCDPKKKKICSRYCLRPSTAEGHENCPDVLPTIISKMKVAAGVFLEDRETVVTVPPPVHTQ